MRPIKRPLPRFAPALFLLIAGWSCALLNAQIPDGLQLQWKLDETTGLTAQDASGNNHPGTLSAFPDGDAQWVAGKNGNALAFTGSNYVSVAGLPAEMSTTWAAWVKLTGTPNNSAVISSTFAGATAGHSLGFGSGADALKPRIVWNHNLAATILLSPTPVQLNEWNHVALTYDAASATLKLYLNGDEQIASTTAATTAFTTINLARREASSSSYLNGVIDDVVVYDRALSMLEIQQLAGKVVNGPPTITGQPQSATVSEGSPVNLSVTVEGLAPFQFQWRKDGQPIDGATNSLFSIAEISADQAGAYTVLVMNSAGSRTSDAAVIAVTPINLANGLQAHWKLDETTGLLAADSTANMNTGFLTDFLGDDSQWVPGEIGGALQFNGANYVEVFDSPSIGAELVNGFTVSTWFRPNVALPATGGTRNQRMLEKGDAFFFLENVGTGGMNFLVKRNNANFTANLNESLQAGEWYHIAGTFDGTSIRVYLNGELEGTTFVGGPIDDDQLPLRIGSDDAGSFFNGSMDDVRIWKRPLNRREILNVLGRDLPEPPSFKIQPKPVTRFAGATASFSVDVRGKEPFRYLWYKDDQDIRSATGPTLTLTNVTPADAGQYKVKVSNALGEVFSDAVTFTVTPVTGIETGLAAYWKFDETSGLTAADSSGSGRNANLVDFVDSTSQWGPGQVNGALTFDGFASRLVVPNSADFAADPEATFAFWIKPRTFGTEQSAGTYNFNEGRILRKPGQFDIFVVDNPGGVRRTIIAQGVNAPQTSLDLDVWQHFTIVFKNGQVQFYKNGFPVGDPKPASIGPVGDQNLVIGSFDETLETVRLFDGMMDDVAIWQRPLSDSEILEIAGKDVSGPPVIEVQPKPSTRLEGNNVVFSVIATGKRPVTYQWFHDGTAIPGATSGQLSLTRLTVADAGVYTVTVSNELGSATSSGAELVVEPLDSITSGLIAYWNFDETSGGTLMDSSGKGNNGQLQNFSAIPGVTGVVGGAYDFDGLDDFIIVPHQDSLNLTDQGTISAWINPRAFSIVGGLSRLVRKSVNYDLTLTMDRGGTLLFYGMNKTAYYATNAAVDLESWQHVAMVFKDGMIQFYKNGEPLGTSIPGLAGEPNTDPLIIGNFQNNLDINRIYSGLMDEIGIWSRALSPIDIEGIYLNGLSGKPLTSSFEPLNVRSIQRNGAQLELTFYSPYADRPYSVQSRASLSIGIWMNQPDAQFTTIGSGLIKAVFPNPSLPASFYRIVAEPPPPLFAEDFESGAQGWTHGGAQDNWELGTPTTGPGSAHGGANVYATGLSSNYLEFTDSYLRSPTIDLTGVSRATLTFWEWRNTDPDPTFHGTIVNTIDPATGAVLEQLSLSAGPTAGWVLRTLRLGPDSLGRPIKLEFRLYSDFENLMEGWFLDDITLAAE